MMAIFEDTVILISDTSGNEFVHGAKEKVEVSDDMFTASTDSRVATSAHVMEVLTTNTGASSTSAICNSF